MTVFDMYDALLKNDSNHELYHSLLSSAEGKLKGEGELSAFELCALLDGMAGFERWDVPIDYWVPDDWGAIDEDCKSAEDLLEYMRYDSLDIGTEYVTRKLCCLIDTHAPKEEIDEWYTHYMLWSSDYPRYTSYPMSDVEIKLFSWFFTQTVSPEEFAESLSSQDIHSLLEFAADELPNHNMPLDETGSEWSKYQIISQYIRTVLCYWLDQKYNWDDIDKWYRLNFVFNYAA